MATLSVPNALAKISSFHYNSKCITASAAIVVAVAIAIVVAVAIIVIAKSKCSHN